MTDATSTTARPRWQERAAQLADLLVTRGDLHDPHWRDAVAAVPRHLLVPTIYEQDVTGAWRSFPGTSEAGMELLYSPSTAVTALSDQGDHQVAVSSSTKPDLMVRMLETLEVVDGNRVLEIGTGTGYNAALLSHRLGDHHVFSVDVDPELVDAARTRLVSIDHHPTLAATDGVHGLPEHGPYDRVIATCSVPSIPWAWAEQLTESGSILADLKIANSAGNLVHLHRVAGDRLEGRFTARWATFMPLRHHLGPAQPEPRPVPAATGGTPRTTTAPAEPWTSHREVWFLAQHALPTGVGIGAFLDPDTRHPTASMLTAPDGSCAAVTLVPGEGAREVTESGPTPLWQPIEDAYEAWIALGKPPWPRFGVTVSPRRQTIWLDDPEGPHIWPIS